MSVLVRIRLVNEDFWLIDGSPKAIPLHEALYEAREFLTYDVTSAVARGLLEEGKISEVDIEFVRLDGIVLSFNQAAAQLKDDQQPLEAIDAELGRPWNDAEASRPRIVEIPPFRKHD